MQLERTVAGRISTNVYLLTAESSAGEPSYVLIDPADDLAATRALLGTRTPDLIVCTHRHLDHVACLGALVAQTSAPVAAHTADAAAICSHQEGILTRFGGGPVPERVDRLLADGDIISFGDIKLEVIHTPGHAPGGICLYDAAHGLLFSGDTLFYQTTGRTDFAEGDGSQMKASIHRLALLPDETEVYPGHGPATTIGAERAWMSRF
jgi:hydroxyacylglutathione hydrolase